MVNGSAHPGEPRGEARQEKEIPVARRLTTAKSDPPSFALEHPS